MGYYYAYAPPQYWGSWWQNDYAHFGVVSYKVTAHPVGSTALYARVKYHDEYCQDLGPFTKYWVDEVSFTTGDCVGYFELSFRGMPYGTAVWGVVSP